MARLAKTLTIRKDDDLWAFRHWVRRLGLFDDATREVCCVDIFGHGKVVAVVTCETERQAYIVECIATHVAILREDGFKTGWSL